MGYTHYWRRQEDVPVEIFTHIVNDFKAVLPIINNIGIELKGGLGNGEPQIDKNAITFNGDKVPAEEMVYARLTSDTDWPTRECGGDCSHETFHFPRTVFQQPAEPDGRYFEFCKTAYKPYDIAVNTCLIICCHWLNNDIDISSDGGGAQWREAAIICHSVLGYGTEYQIDQEGKLTRKERGYENKNNVYWRR